MSLAHVLCNVESFRVTREGHGVFGDEIRIEGWFLTHSSIRSMRIVFAGGATTIPIDHTTNPSEGVWAHHGGSFGDAARNCRFYTAHKVPDSDVDLSTAVLRAETDREIFELRLGAPETPPVKCFTPDESKLVMDFESIGDNCEFGLMQRTVGVERMGLFRYAGVSDVFSLADMIDRQFQGFCEGEDLQITTFGPEWMADIHSAMLNIHTGRIQGLVSRDRIEREERQKLQFLANKFLDDLETGTKTFVYRTVVGQRGGPDGLRGMNRLYNSMTACGGCALLWVTLADDDNPHGTVAHVRDRLYRGYIRQLTAYSNAHAVDEQAWLDLLTNVRAAMAAARDETIPNRNHSFDGASAHP